MKTLKMILVFVLLVGVIFFLMNWKKIVGTKSVTSYGNYINITEKCEEIRKAWENEKEWNSALYQAQRIELKQDSSLGQYKDITEYQVVRNCLRESATNKAHAALFQEFHASQCNGKIIKENYDGILLLKKEEQLGRDERIVSAINCYNLYVKIDRFVKSSHQVSCKFDVETNSWKSFELQKNGVLNTAKNYRNHAIYKKELINNTNFIEGLNEQKLLTRMNSQFSGFQSQLSEQIVRHYESLEVNDSIVNLLNQVYHNFSNENMRSQNLVQLVLSFRERLDKMKQNY